MTVKGVLLLLCGALFVGLGITGWRHRREERINLIEAAILKAGNAEPLPFSRWDRAMAYAHPVFMMIFGPLMILLGIIMLST